MNASSSRAAAAGLPLLSTNRASAEILMAMLEDFHRTAKDSAFKKRIEQAYEKHTGAPFFAPRDDAGFVGVHLKGPPGHGKSTSFEIAAKKFAELTGLNVVSNPPADYPLSKNDFVIVTQEMAGEISNMTMGGLFDRKKITDSSGTEIDVMTKIPYERFESAKKAAGGMLLLDDVACAHEAVQSSLLGLIRNRVYQGQDYSHLFVGLTGNMGSADGAFANKGSSALAGRVRMFYVEDNVEAFTQRILRRNDDAIGDGFVASFLKAHEECFDADDMQMVDSEAPRPQPRTWDSLSYDMRRILHIYENQKGGPSAYFEAHGGLANAITAAAASHIGPKTASVFSAFMDSMITKAHPMAKVAIERGPKALTDEEVHQFKTLVGRAVTNDGQNNQATFQHQYCEAAASIAAQRIAQAWEQRGEEGIKEEVARFCEATYGLSSIPDVSIRAPYQAQAWYALGGRLMARDSMTTQVTGKIRVPRTDTFKAIAEGVAQWSVAKKNETGSMPITKQILEREIMRAISGEAPVFDAGTQARVTPGMTQG